ncbi:hypothetical protein MJH12_16710 [bacterium]|nr:hypothetical protein [bacterium]
MQSYLNEYNRILLLQQINRIFPLVLSFTLFLNLVILYLLGIIYACISVVFLVVFFAGLFLLNFKQKEKSLGLVAKELDLQLGNNDMFQTVLELDSPDQTIVQQELFEQAKIQFDPIFRKIAIVHEEDRKSSNKLALAAILVFLVLCLFSFLMTQFSPSAIANPSKQENSSNSQNSKTNGSNSNANKKNGKSKSGQGKSKKGDGKSSNGQGKSKNSKNGKQGSKSANKVKSSDSKSSKSKKSSKESQNRQQKSSEKSKSSSGKKITKNQKKKKASLKDKKKLPEVKKNHQKKKSKKQSKDSKKGKWNSKSKGNSVVSGKSKEAAKDNRSFDTSNYFQSNEKVLTNVKKMSIPKKYKNKILKIYEELRKSSKKSADVAFPNKN